MNGENAAISPIEHEQRAAIWFREIAFGPEHHGGGRGKADIDHARQCVWRPHRQHTGASPPAVFATRHDVQHAGWMIPRKADIPFHIRVEREHFALGIERDTKRITKAAGNQFPRPSITVCFDQVTARDFHVAAEKVFVPGRRQKPVLGVMRKR